MRVESNDGNSYIEIVISASGGYCLELYEARYDDEELCTYFVRVLPSPTGKYGDLTTAIKESERVLMANSARSSNY